MARILAHFEREDIATLVSLGRFSRPAESAFLVDVLERRLELILERYLTELSPLGDARLDGDVLALTDFALRRRVRPPQAFAFRARQAELGGSEPISVQANTDGSVRVLLRHHRTPSSVPLADASRYVVVTIDDRVARYPLRAHLYDFGPGRGFELVGLERSTAGYDERIALEKDRR